MKIQNFEQIATTPLRRDALMIAEAGLEAIDTKAAIHAGVRLEGDTLYVRDSGNAAYPSEKSFPLGSGRVIVAAIGKCAFAASAALEEILGKRLSEGVAIDVHAPEPLQIIRPFQGTHPIPSEANVGATKALVAMLRQCSKDDFVIFIISGGGSTLLSMPEAVGYEEEAKIVKALTASGATIEELNTIRKHLSLARGGYLAEYANPARSVSLIFSDVMGNDLQFIASGPTIKDNTTIEDAEKILAKYDVLRVCRLEKCGFVKTPKEDEFFANVHNLLFMSNLNALAAMKEKAGELGYAVKVSATYLFGEARNVGAKLARELTASPAKTALLYGGETTVTVKAPGKGGRSQELGLSAMRFMQPGEVIVPFGSDGHDNTDAAGGVCDIVARGKALKGDGNSLQESLDHNLSYDFFKKIGEQVLTGDTGSNVSDLLVALKG
jgi:glycerate-2-kinase